MWLYRRDVDVIHKINITTRESAEAGSQVDRLNKEM
jgi:hypothetical protein